MIKMLICDRCGELMNEDDAQYDTRNSDVGDFIKGCSCGGDWVDATECRICGQWFNDELYIKVCEECLDDNANFENALKVGNEEECQQEIKINGYLAYEFSTNQIEQVLIKLLRETHDLNLPLKYREFLLSDKDYFAEWLEKENE